MTTFLAFLFISVAVLMVLVVLVQRGRGGGLAGAFGSGGGSSSAFGTKTGDVFTALTVVLFVVFMLLAIWLNFRFQDYKQDIPGATTNPTADFEKEHSTTLPGDNLSLPPTSMPAMDMPAPMGTPMPPTTAPSSSQPK